VNLFGAEWFDPQEYSGQAIGSLDSLASEQLREPEKAVPASLGRTPEALETSRPQPPPRRNGNNGSRKSATVKSDSNLGLWELPL